MKIDNFLGQKATPARTALMLILVAIPAFFWFRFLYLTYVVAPSQVSPQMAKMRDSIMANIRKDAAKPRTAAPTAKATKSADTSTHSHDAKKGGHEDSR